MKKAENNKDYQTIKKTVSNNDEDEINLFEYWLIIVKWRKMIGIVVLATVILTIIISLFMTNIYEAKAVIIPVAPKDISGGSIAATLMQQVGGMQGILPGIGSPEASSAMEIILLLKSNILREKIITQYNLLPVLFPDDWDENKKAWKPPSIIKRIIKMIKPTDKKGFKKVADAPSIWDGLRTLDDVVKVLTNTNKSIMTTGDDSIIISVENEDPVLAANIVNYFLAALNDHMSSEAKRVAATNKKYLEEQLVRTADPFIKQKAYNLIAQQIETSMMAEVKENFAFKIIDPPKAPDEKSKPKRALMAILSLVVSLFIGVFIAFFMEYLEKIKTQNRLKEETKL